MDGAAKSKKAASDNWSAYVRARDAGHNEYVEIANKCDDFYVGGGKQWSDADRQRLEDEGKPVLEVNMILSTVNALLGERIKQNAEIKFAPTKGGSAEVAEGVLTPLARHVQIDNNYKHIEGQVFSDGLIQDRGWFDMRMDFNLDVRGEIRIRALDPLVVVPDPLAKEYDTRTWNEVTTTRWMTLDDVEVEYGKKHRKAVETWATSGGDSLKGFEQDCVEWAEKENTFGDPDAVIDHDSRSNNEIKRVRVIERQHKKLGKVRLFIDNATGDMKEIPDEVKDERVAAMAQQHDMSVVSRVRQRVRWTVSCGTHTIKDMWSPYRTFTIVGYFPYFRRGKPFGVVRNLISPQEQLNKAESQELHIVNTTANSGWVIEAGSLVNMTEDELEDRGAETGLVIVHRAGSQPPQKIKPNTVPTGIDRISMKSMSSIKTISGVYDSMLGSQSAEFSGVALDRSLNQALGQMQVPFENLNYSRQIIGEMMYDLLRDFYTEERIYHIIDYNDPAQGYAPVEMNKDMPDGSVLNDITVGEYAIKVDVGPARDNVQDVQLAEAVELRNAGVAVPDYVLIENSHLQNRHELANMIRKIEGFAEPSEEELAQMQALAEYEQAKAMAELEMSKAKAMLLQAQAQQAMAKASELQNMPGVKMAEIQKDLEIEMRTLDQRWEELHANLSNKLQLAGLHADNKSDLTQYTTTAKQTTDIFKERQATLREAAKQKAAANKGTSSPTG